MISEETYTKAANELQIEEAAIKAVAEVESNGSGFLANGKCKILFEPHIFWKRLIAHGIKPESFQKGNEDILYQTWGERPYGSNITQWDRLTRARKINIGAANESASWGKFQIMGENFKEARFSSVANFVTAMQVDENQHLLAFIEFIKSKDLIEVLRIKDWSTFALVYNGKGYKKNGYDVKLQKAYDGFKKI